MARTLLLNAGGTVTQNSALTRYATIEGSFNSPTLDTSEQPVESTWRTAGTFNNLYVRIIANTLNTGTTDIVFRKNRATGNQAVSISAAATGEFEDTTNTDTVAAADEANYRVITGGSSGSISITCISILFAATTQTNTVSRQLYKQSVGMASASTFYRPLSGEANTGNTSTEAQVQAKLGTATTLKNLYVYASANSVNGTSTVQTRINGANGNVTVSIASSTTGVFEDTSNSDTTAVSDLICTSLVTGGSSGTINAQVTAIDVVTTNANFPLISGRAGGVAGTITTYFPISGSVVGDTTELDYRFEVNQPLTISKAFCYVSANSTTLASTLTVRNNGADTAVVISITLLTTGLFEDASNSAAFAVADEINWKFIPGTAASITWRIMGVNAANTIEHTIATAADTIIVSRSTITAAADAKIVARNTIAAAADTIIVSGVTQYTITAQADTKIVARQTITASADAKIVARSTIAASADALVVTQSTIATAADALIVSRQTITASIDAIISGAAGAPLPGESPTGSPTYFNLFQAKEAIDGHTRIIMEIDLVDPKGNRPSGAFWTSPRTIYLCMGEAFLRDSTTTTGFTFYEALVKDFGIINQSCDVGQAIGNIADVQVVLQNARIAAQRDNKDYTFTTGSPAMSPCPSGDDIRFAELFNFYAVIGSNIRIKILFFSGSNTDQLGGASNQYWSDQLFSGIVQEMRFDGDDIILDIVQNQTTASTTLPGRVLTTSPVKDFKVHRAPIAYGDYHTYYNIAPIDDVNGLSLDAVILARMLTPTVIPAYPWKQDNNGNYVAGEDNTKLQTWYMYNDVLGRTNQWDEQHGQVGKPSNSDRIFAYHPEADVFGKIIEGTEGATTSGQTFWPTIASPETEEYIINHGSLRGEAYIPCDRIKKTTSATNITNPQYIFDGSPFTSAIMPLDSTNFIELFIKDVPPLGNTVILAGSIRAYVILDTSTATNGTKLKFGIYRTNPAWAGYWGNGPIESHPGSNTPGYITAASSVFTKGMYDQNDQATDLIPVYAYSRDSGYNEPFTRWEWKCSVGGGDLSDLVVRIEPSVLGSAGQTAKILGAGLIVRYVPNQSVDVTPRQLQVAYGYNFYTHSIDKSQQYYGNTYQINNRISNVPITLWMMPYLTMKDRDSDLGTCTNLAMTAVCDTPIVDPCFVLAHLMLKYGEALSFSDASTPVNYNRGAGVFGSAFGASTSIDDFLASGSIGMSSQLIISEEAQMRDVVSAFCAQWPIMFYRDVMSGNWVMTCYPGSPTLDANRFQLFGGQAVDFHPNILHQSGEDYGKPYRILESKIQMTPALQIFNRFRIKYHYFAPSGTLIREQVITESPNDCIVYSTTTHRTDGKPGQLVSSIGYDPSAVCSASQSRYGVVQWMPTIEAPSIHTDACAFLVLNYLIRRFTQPKLTIEFTIGTEAYNLKPGHIVRISRDFNLVYPYIDYGFEGAKKLGWDWEGDPSSKPHIDYLILSVKKALSKDQVLTTFLAEQIMYGVTGSFWTPANDSLCLSALRADDITGVSDGGAIATWQKLIGQDATQSTAGYKPIYHSSGVNGRPTVEFDGTDDRMIIGSGGTIDAGAVGNYMFCYAVNADVTTGTRPYSGWRYDVGNRIYEYHNHATPNNIAVQNGGTLRDTGADPTTGWQVMVIVCDLTTLGGIVAYRNGTAIGTMVTYAQVRLGNSGAAEIGSDTSGTAFFDGTFSQSAVTKDVTVATRQKYEGMMAHWIGIQASLPTTHPYRYTPPVTG